MKKNMDPKLPFLEGEKKQNEMLSRIKNMRDMLSIEKSHKAYGAQIAGVLLKRKEALEVF